MTDYILVMSVCASELQSRVQLLLKDGWECQGGICVICVPTYEHGKESAWTLIYYQAMIIEVTDADKERTAGIVRKRR